MVHPDTSAIQVSKGSNNKKPFQFARPLSCGLAGLFCLAGALGKSIGS